MYCTLRSDPAVSYTGQPMQIRALPVSFGGDNLEVTARTHD
jgi:hypothetical protein